MKLDYRCSSNWVRNTGINWSGNEWKKFNTKKLKKKQHQE